jgi:hypothetical protein
VAELDLDLAGWPEGARAICRRERPHPGAQLAFTDHEGHRFQVLLTDEEDEDVVALEGRHRARARAEDRIRAAKDTGLRNLHPGAQRTLGCGAERWLSRLGGAAVSEVPLGREVSGERSGDPEPSGERATRNLAGSSSAT